MSERARKWYEEHQYDFEIQTVMPEFGELPEDEQQATKDPVQLYVTTQLARQISERLGVYFAMVAVHPEFMGWTVEEIEANWPEGE